MKDRIEVIKQAGHLVTLEYTTYDKFSLSETERYTFSLDAVSSVISEVSSGSHITTLYFKSDHPLPWLKFKEANSEDFSIFNVLTNLLG